MPSKKKEDLGKPVASSLPGEVKMEAAQALEESQPPPDTPETQPAPLPSSQAPQEPQQKDEVTLKEILTNFDGRISKIESNLGDWLTKMEKIAQTQPPTPVQPSGGLNEIMPRIADRFLSELGGGGASGNMFEEFYKSAHQSFDKVLINTLKKSAGLPSEPEHMTVG